MTPTVWVEGEVGASGGTAVAYLVFPAHVLPVVSGIAECDAGPAIHSESEAGAATQAECTAGSAVWTEGTA